MQSKPRRKGRPPKGDDAMMQPITIRFPLPMMQRIEAIVAARADAPEKGQVIRELVAAGLEVVEAKRAKK